MRKTLTWACTLAGLCTAAPVPLIAQDIVHGLTGTVTSIDSAAGNITVFQDNGTRAVFKDMTAKDSVSFDKRIAAETTKVDAFNKQGAYAIIFYYTKDDDKTVVALKNLGPGPFGSATGTFKKIDGHSHTLIMDDSSGKEHTFKIGPESVAEGMFGVVEGTKFQAQKGDNIRVVSGIVNGAPTALFISEM